MVDVALRRWRAIVLDRVKTANRAAVVPDEDFLSVEFPLVIGKAGVLILLSSEVGWESIPKVLLLSPREISPTMRRMHRD